MSYTDVTSPGGWLKLYGVRIALAAVIGAAGLTGYFKLYGTYNSGQAEHYCEGPLATASARGGVALSCRNPFQGTGVLLASSEQGVYLTEAPYTQPSHLWAGAADTATASGSNVFARLTAFGAGRFLTTAASGSTVRTSGIARVGSGKYLNVKWSYGTSGATTTGKNPGAVRLKWINCSDISSTIRC